MENRRPGRPMKGRSRRTPITVHVPEGLLDAIDEYVAEQAGSFTRSDLFCEAAMAYLQKHGKSLASEELRVERTDTVPKKDEAKSGCENVEK